MNLIRKARRALGVARLMGPKWMASRLFLEAQKRLGWEVMVYPPRAWSGDGWRAALAPEWSASTPAEVLDTWRKGPGAAWGRGRRTARWLESHAKTITPKARESLLNSAREILDGKFTLFSRHCAAVGFPPDWNCNPIFGADATPPRGRHWSRVPMRGEPYGDLKFVWELSRFSWAFVLARAYTLTRDERFAEGFWILWLDWMEKNPPNSTVQWKCGQECSLRLMATCFAVQVFAESAATTPDRFARHLQATVVLAERVERGGGYAKLQDNNHSISEAMGLYTLGTLHPELHAAAHWRMLGLRGLSGEAERLIRPDGTFSQNSNNYHRLMMHDYLWSASLMALSDDVFSPDALPRLRAAAGYLFAITDAGSGGAPNYGPNDGAFILPLEETPYTDYRPAAAAAHFWATGRRPNFGGVGNETLVWLFGADSLSAPVEMAELPAAQSFPDGGVYILRNGESRLFARAQYFRGRPSHADQLHADLWWRGLNIARDGGTYLYYGPSELHTVFSGTSGHNTVCVDGFDQMERGGRFLWATRANADARREPAAYAGGPPTLVLSHDGYARLAVPVAHERRVCSLAGGAWMILDKLSSLGPHDYQLHWRLADWPLKCHAERMFVLETPSGPYHVQLGVMDGNRADVTAIRAPKGAQARGWESLHYGERAPAHALVVSVHAASAVFATWLAPFGDESPLLEKVRAAGLANATALEFSSPISQ